MKLPKGQIELACMRENESMYRLDCVYFDAENKRMIASDGHKLVRVTVDTAEGEKSGLVPWHVMQWARRHGGIEVTIADDGINVYDVNGQFAGKFAKETGKMPNFDKVIPDYKGKPQFALNARLLLETVEALKGLEYDEDGELIEGRYDPYAHLAVHVSLDGDMEPALIVPLSKEFGVDDMMLAVIMPIKREGEKYKCPTAEESLTRGKRIVAMKPAEKEK